MSGEDPEIPTETEPSTSEALEPNVSGEEKNGENSAEQNSPKKKNTNTLFAEKMRMRKKEGDVTKPSEPGDTSTSHKALSTDTESVVKSSASKSINKVKSRIRRRNRQWSKGVLVKKKKSSNLLRNSLDGPLSTEIHEASKMQKPDVMPNGTIKSNKVKPQAKQEEAGGTSKQNVTAEDEQEEIPVRMTRRSRALPVKQENKVSEPEVSAPEVHDSGCRRTEPFVGKLKTKEDRKMALDNEFKISMMPINDANCYSGTASTSKTEAPSVKESVKKDVASTSKNRGSSSKRSAPTEKVSGEKKKVSQGKKEAPKQKKESLRERRSRNVNTPVPDSTKQKEKSEPLKELREDKETNADEAKSTSEGTTTEKRRKTVSKKNKAKEVEEAVCEDSGCRRTEPFVGKRVYQPTPVPESQKVEKLEPQENITSNISLNESKIDDSVSRKESDEIKDSDKSIKESENVKDSVETESTKETKCVEETTLKETECKKESEKETECLNESVPATDTITEATVEDSKEEMSALIVTANTSDSDWSCKRTEPFVGKVLRHGCSTEPEKVEVVLEEPGCSRTIPFVRPHLSAELNEKYEKQRESKATSDTEKIEPDLQESKKRPRTPTKDIDTGMPAPKKIKTKKKLNNSDCSKSEPSPASPKTPSKGTTICGMFSLNCTKHAHHHDQINGLNISSLKKLEVKLSKLEHSTDLEVMKWRSLRKQSKRRRHISTSSETPLKINENNVEAMEVDPPAINSVQPVVQSEDIPCVAPMESTLVELPTENIHETEVMKLQETPKRAPSKHRKSTLNLISKPDPPQDVQQSSEVRDLKVQLIRLETVQGSFDNDYSASEIESLTKKYMDFLMNSNFSCQALRRSVKDFQSSEESDDAYVEDTDSDNLVPRPRTNSQARDDLIAIERDALYTDNEANDYSDIKPLIIHASDVFAYDNGIIDLAAEEEAAEAVDAAKACANTGALNSGFDKATLDSDDVAAQNLRNQESRSKAAVQISDVLHSSANISNKSKIPTNDVSIDKSNVSSEELASNEDESLTELFSQAKRRRIHGINVIKCTKCDKIFVNEKVLQIHLLHVHKEPKLNVNGTSGTPKPKKQITLTRRKYTYNNSLQCNVCSAVHATKERLFEHLVTHTEQELQEAYKSATELKERKDSSVNETEKNSSSDQANADEEALVNNVETIINDSEVSTSEVEANAAQANDAQENADVEMNLQQNSENSQPPVRRQSTNVNTNVQEQIPKVGEFAQVLLKQNSEPVENHLPPSVNDRPDWQAVVQQAEIKQSDLVKPITVCPCHRNETAGLSTLDLQIEMVLLCKTCRVLFRRRDCFEIHYRSSEECQKGRSDYVNVRVPKLFCSSCRFVLNSLPEMRKHLEMHARQNSQGTVTFLCNICKVAFFGVGNIFYNHWFSHNKEPLFVASKYSFPKLSVVSVSDETSPSLCGSRNRDGFFYVAEHVCRTCRLPFASESDLRRHHLSPCHAIELNPDTRSILSTDKSSPVQYATGKVSMPANLVVSYLCDICKKFFESKALFDQHNLSMNHLKRTQPRCTVVGHGPATRYVCNVCKSAFKQVRGMKGHWEKHSPVVELYACDNCAVLPVGDSSQFTYDQFQKHCSCRHANDVRITCNVYFTMAKHVCGACKIGFETERSLKEHQLLHKGATPPQNLSIVQKGGATLTPIAPKESSATQHKHSNSATTTGSTVIWLTDNQTTADGGKQLYPLYVNVLDGKTSYGEKTRIETNRPNSAASNVLAGRSSGTPTLGHLKPIAIQGNQAILSETDSSVLRQMLNKERAEENAGQVDSDNPSETPMPKITNVETVIDLVDSRSNSPAENENNNSANEEGSTDPKDSAKTKYMTKVNPNFEKLLIAERSKAAIAKRAAEKKNSQNATKASTSPTKEPPRRSVEEVRKRIPSDVEVITIAEKKSTAQEKVKAAEGTPVSSPQPFEIVLVTEDIEMDNVNLDSGSTFVPRQGQKNYPRSALKLESNSELSVTTINNSSGKATNDSGTESSSKSFLRVRSVAELQKIQLHLCSFCGVSFDNWREFEIHSKVHSKVDKITNKTSDLRIVETESISRKEFAETPSSSVLPVQMISPMVTGQNSTPSGSTGKNKEQPYWFASCNSGETRNAELSQSESPGVSRTQEPPPSYSRTSGGLSRTGPPPNYPSGGAARTVAIHLPERNVNNALTKRPSGAATRIPQNHPKDPPPLAAYPGSEEMFGTNQTVRSSTSTEIAASGANQPKMYMCSKCRVFSCDSIDELTRHVDTHYQNSATNSHTVKTYGAYQSYQQGNSAQTAAHKPLYACKYCINYKSDNPALVRRHEKSHLLHRPEAQSVYMQQQRQQHLQKSKHMPVSHVNDRPRGGAQSKTAPKTFVCRICNLYSFQSNGELMEHLETAHKTPSSSQVCCYVCDYCTTPLIFDSEDALRSHMNISHNYSCEICLRRYSSRHDLQVHQLSHGPVAKNA